MFWTFSEIKRHAIRLLSELFDRGEADSEDRRDNRLCPGFLCNTRRIWKLPRGKWAFELGNKSQTIFEQSQCFNYSVLSVFQDQSVRTVLIGWWVLSECIEWLMWSSWEEGSPDSELSLSTLSNQRNNWQYPPSLLLSGIVIAPLRYPPQSIKYLSEML